MHLRALISACVVGLAFGLIGCATPGHRIERNPEIFAAFPPKVQETVRRGEVETGYTPDMVYIAYGYPNRKYSRSTENGTAEVWVYSSSYYTTRSVPVFVPQRSYHRDRHGNLHVHHSSLHVDYVRERHVYDRLRVEFMDGVVSAIESERP